jgi:hypothetical protein
MNIFNEAFCLWAQATSLTLHPRRYRLEERGDFRIRKCDNQRGLGADY